MSAPYHLVFSGQMHFLSPNQQRQALKAHPAICSEINVIECYA